MGARRAAQGIGGYHRKPLDAPADPITAALGLAQRIGLAPSEFWSLTPWQLSRLAVGHRDVALDTYHRELFGAWHGAALGRAKRMPKLQRLLEDLMAPAEPALEEDAELAAERAVVAGMMAQRKAAKKGNRHGPTGRKAARQHSG